VTADCNFPAQMWRTGACCKVVSKMGPIWHSGFGNCGEYEPVFNFVVCWCCCCSLSYSWMYNNVRSPASSKHLTLCSSHSACLYLEDDEGRTFSKHMPVSWQDANNHTEQWHEICIISVWREERNNPTLNHLKLYIKLNIWWNLHKTASRFTADTLAMAVAQFEAKLVCSHFWLVHGSCLVWILA